MSKTTKVKDVQAPHTPGPWRMGAHGLEVFGADGFLICDPEQAPFISEAWKNDVQTQYRHWADGGAGKDFIDRSPDEIAANARLIAAAPTMHAEIQRLRAINADLLAACRMAFDLSVEAHGVLRDAKLGHQARAIDLVVGARLSLRAAIAKHEANHPGANP